ncbi:polysaccharide biosynthesis tyrosine autokinase [bacterium]|nr:polysaccharide biosynthesis tyrosine autokinase [bacterium]
MSSSIDQKSYLYGQTSEGPAGFEQGPEEPHLRDYWRVISKRRWTVITVFAVILVTTAISTFRQIPIYQAKIKMQIDAENPNVIKFEEVMNLSPSDRDYNQTQFKILQSRNLARMVIEELRLDESPEFKSEKETEGIFQFLNPGKIFSAISGFFAAILQKESEIEMPDESGKSGHSLNEEGTPPISPEMSLLIDAFLKRLSVEPERGTRLVNVSFSGKYPGIVTQITNTLSRLFIEHNLQLKFAASTEALEWLDGHLGQLKKKVEESEEKLHRYKEEHGIIAIEEKQNIIVQRLSELNSALTNAKTERIRLETLYNQVTKYEGKGAVIESLPSVINNNLIRTLKTDYISLQAEHNKTSQKFGEKHPHIIEISSKMEVIGEKIQAEVKKIIGSIKTEYEIAIAQESVLREALEDQKKEALDLNQKAIQYNVLKREAQSNEQVFNVVLNRVKETDLTRGLKASNIRIIDYAELPQRPIKPNKRFNILLAAIVGLMGGIGIAFFFEYLDDTIKTPEDLKRYFGIPFLGPIPHYEFNQSKAKEFPELITFNDPKSQISEAYKGLRTSILFSIPGEGGKAILITSAGPGEGKTITLANLAVTLAQAGSKVCVLDCDMRKPRVHKIFKMKNEAGVSSLLIGKALVEDVIHDVFVQGLKIIPCGQRPPNPSEILASTQMQSLIESMKESYDYILIDSPPIVAVTDSVMLSRIVDGVCIVIHGGDTGRELVRRSIDLLKGAQAHILGATINNIDVAKKSYYYYYQYYYYSYYGDEGNGHKRIKKRHKHRQQSTKYSSDILTRE